MIAVQRLLRYGNEGFLIYFFLILLYRYVDTLPPALPFILAYLFPALVLFLFSWKRQTIPVGPFLLLILPSAALAWILGFHLALAIPLAVLCFWRAFFYLFNYTDLLDGPDEFYLFLASLLVAMFLYILFPDYAYHDRLFLILVIQFLFLLGTKTFERILGSEDGQMYLRWGGGAAGGLIAAGALLLLLYPVIKWVFFHGFGLIATVIGFLISYPTYWFTLFLKSIGSGDEANLSKVFGNERSSPGAAPENNGLDPSVQSFPIEWIAGVFLACVFLFIIFRLLRNRVQISRAGSVSSEENSVESVSVRSTKPEENRHARPPEDPVRRQLFHLQKKLAVKGMGRSPNESVRDWFARIGLDDAQQEKVVSGYRKVRYGEEALSDEERALYEKAVKALMQQTEKKKKK